MPSARRADAALKAFGYGHLPMLLGIVMVAAAEHDALADPNERERDRTHPGGDARDHPAPRGARRGRRRRRAVEAGAEVRQPLSDVFWGERYGQVTDPFGHRWGLAQHVRDVSREEIEQASAILFGAG